MTVKALSEKLGTTVLALPNPDREVAGAYAGDLLSWVMGRAEEGNVWVTVMTNANVIAVAHLTDVSAVIVSDGSEISPELVTLASDKGVNLLASEKPTYEICTALGALIS